MLLRDFVLPGLLVGIGAAISPGPIFLLIVSETLRGGVRSGWSVAISPLITDIPFIIVSIVLARGIALYQPLVGAISLLGAAFLIFLAYQNLRVRREDLRRPVEARTSLAKGAITNLLNPYLYIFWFSVALPIFARGDVAGSIAFAAALLCASVGSMMIIAILVSLIRMRFLDHLYIVIRAMSVLLLLVAATFIRDGIRLL